MTGKIPWIPSLAMLAIGATLGAVAASRDVTRPAYAAVSSHGSIDAPERPANSDKASCCASGPADRRLLALAARNEVVPENAAQEGKKPNILVIFGDDI